MSLVHYLQVLYVHWHVIVRGSFNCTADLGSELAESTAEVPFKVTHYSLSNLTSRNGLSLKSYKAICVTSNNDVCLFISIFFTCMEVVLVHLSLTDDSLGFPSLFQTLKKKTGMNHSDLNKRCHFPVSITIMGRFKFETIFTRRFTL